MVLPLESIGKRLTAFNTSTLSLWSDLLYDVRRVTAPYFSPLYTCCRVDRRNRVLEQMD